MLCLSNDASAISSSSSFNVKNNVISESKIVGMALRDDGIHVNSTKNNDIGVPQITIACYCHVCLKCFIMVFRIMLLKNNHKKMLFLNQKNLVATLAVCCLCFVFCVQCFF